MSNQLRNVRLYGKLGAKFGRVHRMAVKSPAEAVRALSAQVAGFEAFLMRSKDMGLGYAVFLGGRNLKEEELHSPAGDDDIRIAPMILGSKNGGIFQIILGAVLIVVGTFATFLTGPAGAALVGLGWSMVLGGIVQLLTPVPKDKGSKDKAADTASFTFNGPINTQAQGNPIGVLYGELFIGSAVGSAGIKPVDVLVPHIGQNTGNAGAGGGGLNWRGLSLADLV